jgi:hypothetical protein
VRGCTLRHCCIYIIRRRMTERLMGDALERIWGGAGRGYHIGYFLEGERNHRNLSENSFCHGLDSKEYLSPNYGSRATDSVLNGCADLFRTYVCSFGLENYCPIFCGRLNK